MSVEAFPAAVGAIANISLLDREERKDGEGLSPRPADLDNEPVVVHLPAAAEPIPIYRRGHPLTHDLRSRVMRYLQQGVTKTQIATKLCISRCTVQRYEKLAVQQNQLIPSAKPRGGY